MNAMGFLIGFFIGIEIIFITSFIIDSVKNFIKYLYDYCIPGKYILLEENDNEIKCDFSEKRNFGNKEFKSRVEAYNYYFKHIRKSILRIGDYYMNIDDKEPRQIKTKEELYKVYNDKYSTRM